MKGGEGDYTAPSPAIGYYNTVGSKEGQRDSSLLLHPYTFLKTPMHAGWRQRPLSRSERAACKGARPEDFVDEEDLAALMEQQDELDKEEEEKAIAAAREEFNHGKHDLPECVCILFQPLHISVQRTTQLCFTIFMQGACLHRRPV